MKTSACALASALVVASPALADDRAEPSAETIIVTAPRVTALAERTDAEDEHVTSPDGAAFVARQPGAALVANGALSGQVQMRGLFGERILLRINGQHFATGGPNAMDPALHYAPMALIDRVEIARGISPVRDGPGLGGGVNAILKQVRFAEGQGLSPQVDASAQYRSADDGVALGGMAGLASERVRIGVIGSWEKGGDVRFPGGRIAGTAHRRAVYGVHAGFRTDAGDLSLEYRRQDTGRSGNPPFAMDIVYFHTDFVRAAFEGDVADAVRLEAHADYAGVSHRMNNFGLRPSPPVAMVRQSDTYADTLGAGASLRFGGASRHVRIGVDGAIVDKGYRLYNPFSPAFFVHPLDRAKTGRIGGFAEWRGRAGPLETELGLRVDRHDAGTQPSRIDPGVPPGIGNLARDFAAADRAWSGETMDASLRLWAGLGAITPRLTLARKTRAPSLIERFSWLPTEASGGLADGNIYVGNPALKPEAAWIAEAGFDWANDRFYARPVVYLRRVDRFIQGVPYDATPGVVNSPVESVAQANGDATPLRFANVDARIWGADIAFGARLAGSLRVDGVISHVRGRRRDIEDNLYRMAPTNGRVALAWDTPRWSVAVEVQGVAAQNAVSAANGEVATPGYVLAHINGHWIARTGLRLDVGVENLFDRRYADHLAGYNRIALSDVPPGARLPGPGRSAFVRLRWVGD